ncbi:MAG: ABC transporter permease [Gemmatimonadaceae bacterium]
MKRQVFQFPWRSRNDIRHDVDEELQFHIESRERALVATGMSATEAHATALREFGDVDDARQYMRSIDGSIENTRRRKDYFNDLAQDLRYAFRSLRATPTFTIIAILTLAIGIGANTAIFSVVHSVLQKPLPFSHAERLVRVWSANASADLLKASVSAVDLDDWRAQRQQIEDIGGWWYSEGASGTDLIGHGAPQRVSTAFVSPGFFTTLQTGAIIGRLPREEEMVRGGDDRVVVLSFGYWQRNFGGDTTIVGTRLTLNGEPFRVIGVMPASFAFPATGVEAYVPFSTIPDAATPRIRPVRIMDVVARLKANVSIDQARAEMSVITKRLAAQYPQDAAWGGVTLMPLQEAITGSVQEALFVLLGAVTFVLLMACVNVASLTLARSAARERELAIRVSIGATGGRLFRQLITESLVLSVIGGMAGYVVALFGTRGLVQLSAGQLPRSEEVHLDSSVLLFVLGVSLLSGLLFGLAPAIRTMSVNLQGMLRASGRTSTRAAGTFRNALVVIQVAFAVVLSVGSGLMTRSFNQLLQVNAGFKPDHLLAVNFTINTDRHGDTTWQHYYSDVIAHVRAVPGVAQAGAAQYAPFRGMGERNAFLPPGFVVRPGEEMPQVPTQRVSDGYFRTIGTPVLRGREFLATDRVGAPFVIVVNEAFAKKYFAGADPLGKAVAIGGRVSAQIVGVVGDIRQSSIADEAQPLMYLSNLQNGRVKVTLVSRTSSDPLKMVNSIRNAIWAVDRDQTITSIFTFDDVMNESLARPRMIAVLFSAFGVVGIVLGVLGIYGVLAFLVAQRKREIGVRIALGAHGSRVMLMVMQRGLLLASVGVVAGITVALILSQFVKAILYGVTPTDPSTYGAVVLLFVVVAALATLIPARRAARVDPLVAMQGE